jgi:hypothetical protein
VVELGGDALLGKPIGGYELNRGFQHFLTFSRERQAQNHTGSPDAGCVACRNEFATETALEIS